jgi:DNA polymerase-3 subunit epsilon
MTWHLEPMAPFDVESGGVDVENDGVVTVTVASVGAGPMQAWSGLIAVDFDIDPKATEVHHITTEFAQQHGRPAAEVLDEAATRLAASLTAGIAVVGMNLVFDWTILDRNCTRYGVKTVSERLGDRPLAPIIDVLCIDKQAREPVRALRREARRRSRRYRGRAGGGAGRVPDRSTVADAVGRAVPSVQRPPLPGPARPGLAGVRSAVAG